MICVQSLKIHVAKIFTRQNPNNSCARKIHALQYAVLNSYIETTICNMSGMESLFHKTWVKKYGLILKVLVIGAKVEIERLCHQF